LAGEEKVDAGLGRGHGREWWADRLARVHPQRGSGIWWRDGKKNLSLLVKKRTFKEGWCVLRDQKLTGFAVTRTGDADQFKPEGGNASLGRFHGTPKQKREGARSTTTGRGGVQNDNSLFLGGGGLCCG